MPSVLTTTDTSPWGLRVGRTVIDILSQGGEKTHEMFHGKGGAAVAPQGRHARLFDPQDIAGFRHPHLENREMWGTRISATRFDG